MTSPSSSLDDNTLKDLQYFHGFLPREDLGSLLKKEGEFLVRCSEVENNIERNLIISYYNDKKKAVTRDWTQNGEPGSAPAPESTRKKSHVRHIVIHKKDRKYYLRESQGFESVDALVQYHSKNEVTIGDIPLKLNIPIPRQKWELLHSNIELEKELGHGQFGEVRSGKMTLKSGKKVDVAVKLMKGTSELSKAKRREMMAEARQMRDLRHPNVVRIYGVAVIDMPLYIVLELIDGGSLDKYLKQNKNLKSPDRKQVIMHAAWGIEYIHSKNIVHRDLAARNCLIIYNTKVIKISDFGMARPGPFYKIHTRSKVPIRWMAPETIQTFCFTFKSDVWSFGMIVYEIYWEGEPPFKGKTNAEVSSLLIEGVRPVYPEVASRKLVRWFNEHLWTPESKRATISEVCEFLEGWSKMKRPKVTCEEEEESEKNVNPENEETPDEPEKEKSEAAIKPEKVERRVEVDVDGDSDREQPEKKDVKRSRNPKMQPSSGGDTKNEDSSEDAKIGRSTKKINCKNSKRSLRRKPKSN